MLELHCRKKCSRTFFNVAIHLQADMFDVRLAISIMQVILKENQIAEVLDEIAEEITAATAADVSLALVGVRSRGEILAQRLQKLIQDKRAGKVELGTLDITLYRDDLNQMSYQQPEVRTTEIDFGIDDRLIVLVDDVLKTGRSVRAAMDALIDLGRPQAIRLAVLIDRGSRELPIRADYVGKTLEVPLDETVQVYLHEVDEKEEVVVE
jgi:pyrimidine operon attenuation protein / uracil phosphoribosyltransferase